MKKLFIVLCFNLILFGAGLTFSKEVNAEEIFKASIDKSDGSAVSSSNLEAKAPILEVLYSDKVDGAILSINGMKGLYRLEAGKMDDVSKIFGQYFEWEKTGAKNADTDNEIKRLPTIVVFVAKGEDETPTLGEVELVYSLSSQNEGQPQLKIDIVDFKKIKTGLKASKYFKPDALYLKKEEVISLQRLINPEFADRAAAEFARRVKEQDNK